MPPRVTLQGLAECSIPKRFQRSGELFGSSFVFESRSLQSYRRSAFSVYANKSASVHTREVIPASIAGVTRKVLWIRQKL